jgi:hypothetical protein
MNEGFQTYADNLQKLGTLFNENQKALRNAFELVDAHQAVLRRIANDVMRRAVRPTPLVPGDEEALDIFGHLPHRGMFTAEVGQTIDYGWYFEQYNLTGCVIMMGVAIRKFLKLDEKQEPEQKPEPAPPQDNDMSFGGDYGEQNQIHGNPG